MAQNNPSFPVQLFVYDMSRGMARQLSSVFLGTFVTFFLVLKYAESYGEWA